MNDMSAVIVPKSDQWNADDLLAGPRTITVERVSIKPGAEQPVSIHIVGEDKVYRPCKSMSRVLVSQWGPDANQYVGKSMTLFCDPKVQWGGLAVGGIRISHMSHIEKPATMALTATKGSRKPFTVQPLKAGAQAVRAAQDGVPNLQFDNTSSQTWLASLAKHLDAAKTRPEVDAVISHPDVAKTLRDWPVQGKEQINRLTVAAIARTAIDPAPALAEEPFPGDTP